MIKQSIFIFIPFLFAGCGNAENKPDLSNTAPEKDPLEEAVDWAKIQNRNGDAYLPNTDVPYSGWAKRTFENGQVEALAEFTNGSVTRLKQWKENGIPTWDVSFSIGKVTSKHVPINDIGDLNEAHLHGAYVVWHENGQKNCDFNFKDGKQEGSMNTWYENGQTMMSASHKAGKLHGELYRWHENGQKQLNVNFNDGKKDGLEFSWYKNGQKHSELKIAQGKFLDGQIWLPNGEICNRSNLKDGNGSVCFYDDNGTLVVEETFLDGDFRNRSNFYESGQKSKNFICKDGKLHGLKTSWHENGQISEKGLYKDGKKEGVWTEWFENGVKENEINYLNGEFHGLWTNWKEDGSKVFETNYKNGNKDGDTKFF